VIKAGRNGQVKYDAAGNTPVEIVSLNNWKLDLKTEKINVTCFGDQNKVYVPGMKDLNGTFAGFWNSDELTLFEAADVDTPGLLELIPNSTEPTFKWSGLAYMDASIDTAVEGAPSVQGTFMAAGPWTTPATVTP
jgi:hypothetical protein